MRRVDSLEMTLFLEKIEGRGEKEWQSMNWLDNIIDSMDMSLSKLQEIVKDREAWHAAAPWGGKESNTIEQLNRNSVYWQVLNSKVCIMLTIYI